ncbi:hypothetical protein ACFV44_04565 [Streptomyces sp. NPDC059780]|uniref:hypothetical protein n=2 Tax=unclassified Streptomyces TaxID=2593676 RepID=UPI0011612C60
MTVLALLGALLAGPPALPHVASAAAPRGGEPVRGTAVSHTAEAGADALAPARVSGGSGSSGVPGSMSSAGGMGVTSGMNSAGSMGMTNGMTNGMTSGMTSGVTSGMGGTVSTGGTEGRRGSSNTGWWVGPGFLVGAFVLFRVTVFLHVAHDRWRWRRRRRKNP